MPTAAYERVKERAAARSARLAKKGRDIGPIPKVRRPSRKKAARLDFRRFCLTYFPAAFTLPFCADHLKVVGKIEGAVRDGGLFAVAMPRGSGKTTLCECACLWALLYGHRRFVVLIAADEGAAGRMLESIKTELEANELLAEDFPEVCYPVARLERISKKQLGQTCRGRPTFIRWAKNFIVLPMLKGSRASGGVARIAGLTASVRGLKHKLPDGRAVRPDLVVTDDPQTDESARSASQVAYRERVIAGAVLGLAGPGQKIAGVMPCTVIAPGDLADRHLDPKIHPEWNGERTRMVYAFPARADLWEQYAELRREGLRRGDGGAAATEFYRANRAAMDEGARVAWPENFRPGELSALQYAMNLRTDDAAAFAAERQNDPLPLVAEEPGELKAGEVAARANRCPRGAVPPGCTRLTAFADVQADLLFWCVCGWSEGFGGAVVDYGTFPDQGREYFTLADARPTLAQATRVPSLEGSLYAGMEALSAAILGREWPGQQGGTFRVEKLLVDSGWGQSTDLVHRFCRQSAHAALLTPSKGVGIGAAMLPIADWPRQEGERRGPNWVLRIPASKRGRVLLYDANVWKSTVAAKLRQPLGETTGLTLFGDNAPSHRLFAEHCTAEYRVKTFGRGRECEEWKPRPHRPDNHYFDAIVGCAVAASLLGVAPAGVPDAGRKGKRQRVSFSEMQARARGGR